MYQFEHILCPTDFSEASLTAIRFVSHAVRQSGGEITLLYVDEFEASPLGYFESDTVLRNAYRKRAEDFAQDRFHSILGAEHLNARSTHLLVKFGTAYKEIISVAESSNISAVAQTTVGLGNSSPYLIGRTTERVVRLCRTPVLTIRPRPVTAQWGFKTILCPTDFSEYSNYAMPYAISLARRFGAKLLLLYVADLAHGDRDEILEKFPEPSVYHERANEVDTERIIGRDISPENTIVQVVQERGVDFIVIGTHGSRGLHRVQIGNTTEEVIRRVEVPVLSVTHPVHRNVFPRRFYDEYRNEQIATGS